MSANTKMPSSTLGTSLGGSISLLSWNSSIRDLCRNVGYAHQPYQLAQIQTEWLLWSSNPWEGN
jgi:hypothetical protein